MSKFIKVLTNKWLQLASLIINLLFTVYSVFSYINLENSDPNFTLKRSIFLMGMIVFGLFSILQIISFFLKIKANSKK